MITKTNALRETIKNIRNPSAKLQRNTAQV